jgi:hypothetical protein
MDSGHPGAADHPCLSPVPPPAAATARSRPLFRNISGDVVNIRRAQPTSNVCWAVRCPWSQRGLEGQRRQANANSSYGF